MKTAMLILIVALRGVESSNGLTSANQLQIQDICVQDVNRIYGTLYTAQDVYDYKKSREIAELYLTYWGEAYRRKTGRPVDYEVLARIWNGGPNGWKKPSTLNYWKKVRRGIIIEESKLKGKSK
jgi:hypothetical protein